MATSIKQFMTEQDEWIKSLLPDYHISRYEYVVPARFAICNNRSGEAITEYMTRDEWHTFRWTINLCGEAAFKAGIERRYGNK